MKVSELIAELQEMPEDCEVVIWDEVNDSLKREHDYPEIRSVWKDDYNRVVVAPV